MARRWMSCLLLGVVWATLPALAQAQNSTDPVPLARLDAPGYGAQPMGGATPMYPQPGPLAGYAPGMGGAGMPYAPPFGDGPGPQNGSGHPPGLLSCLFSCCAEDIDDDTWHVLATGQYMHLTRSNLKSHLLAVVDTVGFDDGLPPPRSAPAAAHFSDLNMDDVGSYRVSVGFYREGIIFEVAGFQIPRSRSELNLQNPGQLTSFFFNPPLGFEGTNPGLWDNADVISLHFSHALYGFEGNVRWINNFACVQSDVLVGIRYMDVSERMSIFTDDDAIQVAPDPLNQATYVTSTHNHLLGLQAGLSMHQVLCGPLAASWDVKGAWCANLAEIEVNLTRGDGFVGRTGGSTKYSFAQVYETGLYLDLQGSFWRLRGGYQLMVLNGIATAENQLNWNLEASDGRGNMRGTSLYHGPAVMLDLFF